MASSRVINTMIHVSVEQDTSLAMKKQVFDKLMLLERLTEEEAILVVEMKQHWNNLLTTCRALKDQAGVLSDDIATQSEYLTDLWNWY